MRNIISIIIVSLGLYSCETAPKNILELNKIKVIVWQLMKVDDFYSRQSVLDSTWKSKKKNVELYEQVFALNNVTAVDFYKSMDFYEKHPIAFKELMDSVAVLSKREKIVQPPLKKAPPKHK